MQKIATKLLLAQSLLELSKTKELEKITVTDITKHCSLRRESFYYHFYDKYQLIKWMYEYNIVKSMEQYIGKESWGAITIRFLKLIRQNKNFYQNALADTNINNFYSCMFKDAVKIMNKFIFDKLGEKKSYDMMFYISIYCYGTINMICDWIRDGMVEGEEKIGRLIEDSMPNALKKYFVK
jgi:probable dihydroxyacetone kinase regulator